MIEQPLQRKAAPTQLRQLNQSQKDVVQQDIPVPSACRHLIFGAMLVLTTNLLVACGGGGGSSANAGETADANDPAAAATTNSDATTVTIAAVKTDLTMLALESIYYNKRTPDGFYSENEPSPDTFQTITHIRNINILAASEYNDTIARYELCSNDFYEALAWSNLSAGDLGVLVDNSETALYFQFTRSPVANPLFSNIQRVFKCDILDRSALDIRVSSEQLGIYNQMPQQPSQIKSLIEYMWLFSEANTYGNAVLTSTISEQEQGFVHRMDVATLTTAANRENHCDQIAINLIEYSIDKLSGAIQVSQMQQQSITAQFDGATISYCDA